MEAEIDRELLLKMSAHVVPQGVAVWFTHLLGFWYCFGGAAGKLTEEIPLHSFNLLKTSFIFCSQDINTSKISNHERSSHSGCSKNSERGVGLDQTPKTISSTYPISMGDHGLEPNMHSSIIMEFNSTFFQVSCVLFVCLEFHSTRFKAGSFWTHSHLCSHFVRALCFLVLLKEL